MNRKRLIAGIALLAVLVALCILGSNLVRNEWKSRQGQVGHRAPLPALGYCSSQQIRPCILSINISPNGGMLINVLVYGSSPDFYVKIRHANVETIYECKRAKSYSIYVYCTGNVMPIGESLSFRLISQATDTTLAEGSFPIIGLALATPYIAITPTPITIERQPR